MAAFNGCSLDGDNSIAQLFVVFKCLFGFAIVLTACGVDQKVVTNSAATIVEKSRDSVPAAAAQGSGAAPSPARTSAPLPAPVGVTGLRIGDRSDPSAKVSWLDQNGAWDWDRVPEWIAASDGEGMVVGYVRPDRDYVFASPEQRMAMPNPMNVVWNESGDTIVGCLTADGYLPLDGKSTSCE